MNKSNENSDIDWKLMTKVLGLYLFSKFIDFLTFITKYYPFSNFFLGFVFHNKYEYVREIRKKIYRKFNAFADKYDKDENFYYIFYKEKDIDLKKLKNLLKNKNVFVSDNLNGLVKISIPKN